MIEFKYLYFAIFGIGTALCVILCSIIFKSSKIVLFPHINLFGNPVRYILRYIPFLTVLLVIILTILSIYPFKREKLFSNKKIYNIVICLDVSNSMKEKQKLVVAKKALRDFVLKRDIEDRIGIVVFDNVPFRLVPLTTDRNMILNLIPKIHPAMVDMGGTSMYDGLIEALKSFNPAWKNKIIILLSDGGDINSKNTLEDVIAYNRSINAKIYTIGISSGIHSFALEHLSESSGGKAFFITTKYKEAINSIFSEINRLEPSYVREFSYEIEKPADLYIKILAIVITAIILVRIIYKTTVKNEEINF